MRSLLHLGLLSGLLCGLAFAAEEDDKVYRYTDSKGVTHYTDKPPAKNAKPIDLPKLQTYSNTLSGSSAPAPPPVPLAPRFSLAINSPTPEQTFRDNDTQVSVSVTVLPALVSGYGLIYALNGQPQNTEPLNQTSFTLSGVERGTHAVSATLIGLKGEVLASNSVTIHVRQPVAKAQGR